VISFIGFHPVGTKINYFESSENVAIVIQVLLINVNACNSKIGNQFLTFRITKVVELVAIAIAEFTQAEFIGEILDVSYSTGRPWAIYILG
jgi:hypothetical protein